MESFFDIMPETDTLVKPKAVKTIREVDYSCESCGLYKRCDSPKMKPMGNVNSKLLVVIDSPSRLADRRHKPASGETLQVLKELCVVAGIEFTDICVVNAIQCRHSVLNKSTIPVCRNRLKTFINDHDFVSVIAMGTTAMTVLFGNLISCGEMAKLENNAIPLLDCKTTVYPTYSVHDFVVEKRNNVILLKMGQAFKKAIGCTPFVNYQTLTDERIEVLTNTEDIISGIVDMIASPLVKAFDYEATGLQPYRKGHEIICMSIATTHKSIVFLITPAIKEIVAKFLQSSTPKVAHNAKFEMIWSKSMTGEFPNNIVGDTMINAHCINNTKGITSLKYQSFLHFGIAGYDDDIKYLWESNEDTIHAFNQLYYYKKRGELQLIANKLCTYCAYDSLFTAWLYEKQRGIIEQTPHIMQGIKLFVDATRVFADTEYNGMKIDVVAVETNLNALKIKLEAMHEILYETPEVALWDKPTAFNHASNPDLAHLLYTIMGCTPTKYTKTKQPSTDVEALEKLAETQGSEFLEVLMKYRKLEKIKSTYLDGIRKNTLDNYIHPSFNFNVVPTFRSCVAEGTKVLVCKDNEKHPDGIPIEEVREGDYVYCFSDTKQPAIRKVLWAGKTGHREVVRVHYSVNGGGKHGGGYIDVTPEHKIRLIDGSYVEAQHLLDKDHRTEADSRHSAKTRTLSCSRSGDKLNFTGHLKHGKGVIEHRLVYEQFSKEKLTTDDVIHHLNWNHKDNSFTNLMKTTKEAHGYHHGVAKHLDKYVYDKDAVMFTTDNSHPKARDIVYVPVPRFKINKIQCIRALVKAKGLPTHAEYSYDVMKRAIKLYSIKYDAIKIRYDKNGGYISKNKLRKYLKIMGFTNTRKVIGHNYYKLKKLCEIYGIEYNRKWANQFGEFVPGNHVVMKVEWINKVVDVYDIEVEEFHNFFANEICVHNSSSGAISFQNLPKRSNLGKKYVRSTFIPDENTFLEELDFSSLEVNIGACLHKDPQMLTYLASSDSNMHTDTAYDLFLRTKEDLLEEERQVTKGGFTFSQQFGSYYVNCAITLWETMPKESKIHLASKGYKTLGQYTLLVKEAERVFWEERFGVFGKWREANYKQYLKTGYIDFNTGFRSTTFRTQNQVHNIETQGSAFHCLLSLFLRIDARLKERGMGTRLIGQVHDSIVACVVPEEETFFHVIVKECLQDLTNEWKWVIVPLELKYEQAEVGAPWNTMKEKGAIRSK